VVLWELYRKIGKTNFKNNNMALYKEIEQKVKEIITDKLGVDEMEVVDHVSFTTDLGADSLDTVELIMEVEKEFNISIPDEDAEKIATVGDLSYYIKDAFSVEKIVETKALCFRVREDGKIEVILKLEDGSWCYADGVSILPSNISVLTFSKWTNILKELEDIINDPKSKESDLQKFFETHPELIAGNDYDVVLPQAVIVKDDDSIWKSDFVLTPKNQHDFAKVLELKIPSTPIVNRPQSGHTVFSAKIWKAIEQLKDYRRAFDSKNVRERFKSKYGVDVFKPDLHLIAGKKWDIQLMDSVRELQSGIPVKIEDWDSVLDRLRRNFT